MATNALDLWPQDLSCEDVLTPEEILQAQANAIEERTNGLVIGQVVRSESEDRIVLGFEIASALVTSRTRLFEVLHRKELEYPAAVASHMERLPKFLRREYVEPGLASPLASYSLATALKSIGGPQVIKNEWVAHSPTELKSLLGEVLGSPETKSAVISMVARSQRARAIQQPHDPGVILKPSSESSAL